MTQGRRRETSFSGQGVPNLNATTENVYPVCLPTRLPMQRRVYINELFGEGSRITVEKAVLKVGYSPIIVSEQKPNTFLAPLNVSSVQRAV